MVGANKLFINQSEMHAAIEYYLNNIVLKVPCTVTSVVTFSRDGLSGFEIGMKPKEDNSGKLMQEAIAIPKEPSMLLKRATELET